MTLLMAEQDPVTSKYRTSDKLLEAQGKMLLILPSSEVRVGSGN